MLRRSNMEDFIGAEYISTELGEIVKTGYGSEFTFYIYTNRGSISLMFYNYHNGYYETDELYGDYITL